VLTSKYRQVYSTLTFFRICQTALFLHCELDIWFCTTTKITIVLIIKQFIIFIIEFNFKITTAFNIRQIRSIGICKDPKENHNRIEKKIVFLSKKNPSPVLSKDGLYLS